MEDNLDSIVLLKDISKGSRKSFEQFYEKYHLFVFQIALHIMDNQIEAEDVCHDVFLEIYQKASEYDENRGSVKAWLAVKTKSRALDRIRRKKPLLVDRLEEIIRLEVQGAEAEFIVHNERQILYEALSHLPAEQREAIIESYFQGKTHKEISTSMNKPLGTVKSLIRYGLNNLRKQKSLLTYMDPLRGGKQHDK